MAERHSRFHLVGGSAGEVGASKPVLARVDAVVDLVYVALRELDTIEASADTARVQDRASIASSALDSALRELKAAAVTLSA